MAHSISGKPQTYGGQISAKKKIIFYRLWPWQQLMSWLSTFSLVVRPRSSHKEHAWMSLYFPIDHDEKYLKALKRLLLTYWRHQTRSDNYLSLLQIEDQKYATLASANTGLSSIFDISYLSISYHIISAMASIPNEIIDAEAKEAEKRIGGSSYLGERALNR